LHQINQAREAKISGGEENVPENPQKARGNVLGPSGGQREPETTTEPSLPKRKLIRATECWGGECCLGGRAWVGSTNKYSVRQPPSPNRKEEKVIKKSTANERENLDTNFRYTESERRLRPRNDLSTAIKRMDGQQMPRLITNT